METPADERADGEPGRGERNGEAEVGREPGVRGEERADMGRGETGGDAAMGIAGDGADDQERARGVSERMLITARCLTRHGPLHARVLFFM